MCHVVQNNTLDAGTSTELPWNHHGSWTMETIRMRIDEMQERRNKIEDVLGRVDAYVDVHGTRAKVACYRACFWDTCLVDFDAYMNVRS